MCSIIEFHSHEFKPQDLYGLRIYGSQVRMALTDNYAMLPIRYDGGNRLIQWGNRFDRKLPRTGYCRKESVLQGKWSWLKPEPVEIIANRGFSNGTWFQVRVGIKGILVRSSVGKESVYILTEPATHYYKVMTGATRMPVLIDQVI